MQNTNLNKLKKIKYELEIALKRLEYLIDEDNKYAQEIEEIGFSYIDLNTRIAYASATIEKINIAELKNERYARINKT